MQPPLVLVDAENVRRSRWPNLSGEELVARCRAWAAERDVELLVVFDGAPPERAPDLDGAASADDAIAGHAYRLRAEGRAYWLVTSDRGLRARAADGAERVVGGGGFLGELGAS